MNFIKSIIFLSLAAVDYKDNDPESPTRPDIRYKFESLHASPFRLLAILKPTTPIISIALSPTCSASHLLAFLESTVPSLPPPSWTSFVIFCLSPVGAVGRDIGTVTLLQLRFSCVTTTIFWSQQLKISNSTYTAPSPVQAIATTILRSKRLNLLSLLRSIFRLQRLNFLSYSKCLSPVGAVGRATDFHLIDQGKVGYLYHLQILLFNLQDALTSVHLSSSLSTLLLILRQYNNNNDRDNTVDGTTVESYAQTYHNVYKCTYDHSPGNNNNDEKTSTYVMAAPAVMMKAYQFPAVKHAHLLLSSR